VGALLLLAAATWLLGSALELSSVELAAKVVWDKMQFLGICIIPTGWLVYTLYYTGREGCLSARNLILLSIVPLITFLLVITNERHGLIWRDTWLDTTGRFTVKQSTYGAGLWAFTAYSYVQILAGLGLLLSALVRTGRLYRWQAGALLLIVTLAWLINAVELLLDRDAFHAVELTPFALAVTVPILAWAFYRLQLRDIVPVARGEVLEGMSDGVIVVDAEGRVVDLNPVAQELLHASSTEVAGRPLKEVWPTAEKGFPQHNAKIESEMAMNGAEGQRTFDVRISPLTDWRGRVVCRVFVLRDITERKQAEKALEASLREKEALLQEVHHRVKNNLQVISSLLNLQADYVNDPQALQAFQDSQNRIRSMALIHERLYQSRNLAQIDFAEYIRSLSASLFRSYGVEERGIVLDIQASEVLLKIDAAVPCGLILNELISNALNHAFPQERKGRVCVDLRAQQGQVVLTVADDGVGLPPEVDVFNPDSLGLQLVNALVDQVDGTLALERGNGTTFRLTFPSKG
jgi:PAS domain S-box-containing protein